MSCNDLITKNIINWYFSRKRDLCQQLVFFLTKVQ